MLNLGMTEYEINKMIIAQLPSLVTEKQLAKGKTLIKDFMHAYVPLSMGHYMLLCNDIHSYTVFEVCNEYEEKSLKPLRKWYVEIQRIFGLFAE